MVGLLPPRLAGRYTNAGQVDDRSVHPRDQGQVDSAHHGRHPVGRHPSAAARIGDNNTIRLLLLLSSTSSDEHGMRRADDEIRRNPPFRRSAYNRVPLCPVTGIHDLLSLWQKKDLELLNGILFQCTEK
jgi:hypothetical protein